MAKVKTSLLKQRALMKKYAKVLGYKYIPFNWKPTDYSVKGWQRLIHRVGIETLKENLKSARHQMKLRKPGIGLLGNEYHYWEEEKLNLENKLEKLIKTKPSI